MRINLAKSSGFCFGVKRALNIAYRAAKERNNVYMLGDIVHNEDVIRDINKVGVKKIKYLSKGKNRTLLIRAHGAGIETFKKARESGYQIIDATCPMVKEIHRIARRCEEKGYAIIVIGDRRHDEVQGITHQIKSKSIIIDCIERMPFAKIRRVKKAAVVVQSTQTLEKTSAIVNTLRKYINELEFFNTICRPTRIKQREIRIMPLKNDVVIIVGSKSSANTKRLYEISKSLSKRSFWVQSKEEIKPYWFKNAKNVGIAAGSSTPEYTTKEVISYIRKLDTV